MTSSRAFDKSGPAFQSPLPVGQLYFPSWDRYEAAMRGIFERQYYNNDGPLLQDFESRLRDTLGVKHAICTGNATFGLMMVIEALGIKGSVLMPSFTFISTAQSVIWCGGKVIFCDVDSRTHHLCPSKVEEALSEYPEIEAIVAVNLWGGAADIAALKCIAKAHGLPLVFDSAHAFGCMVQDSSIGTFGVAEVFSFHATKVLSATEGGCVTTNDDALAARIRGMRPSYGSAPTVEPFRVLNSRMSEAQAAVGLLSLEDFSVIQMRNKSLYDAYGSGLSGVQGIKLLSPSNVSKSNYSYAVCELDEVAFGMTRDQLLQVLEAENVIARRYFYPGIHRSAGFDHNSHLDSERLSVTEKLCSSCLQLPLGARLDIADVVRITDIIARAQSASGKLASLIPRRC